MITDYARYFENIPECPHCGNQLSCCEAPPIHVGDGLGWGSEILYICLNDYCPLFLKGWEQIELKYGHHASYRYMQVPGSREENVMMVGNADAFKASVINLEEINKQNKRYHREKEAVAALEICEGDDCLEPVMTLILDEAATLENRKKAVEMLTKINSLDCIDPIRNHKFRDTSLESDCNMSINLILAANYKKECPFCKEIIKAQASLCMHCKKEL